MSEKEQMSIDELEDVLNKLENEERPPAVHQREEPVGKSSAPPATAPGSTETVGINTDGETPVESVAEKGGSAERPSAAPSGGAGSSKLSLNEFVNADQLKRDVAFDPNDLDPAVREHAALFVHYSNLARLARRQFEQMKVTVDVLCSRLYAIHRERLLKEGGKATEALIEASVKSDPRYYAAQKKLIDARAIYDLASDAREAFSQRKDMIIQTSVDRRRERDGELRVKTAEAVNDAREAAMQRVRDSARANAA